MKGATTTSFAWTYFTDPQGRLLWRRQLQERHERVTHAYLRVIGAEYHLTWVHVDHSPGLLLNYDIAYISSLPLAAKYHWFRMQLAPLAVPPQRGVVRFAVHRSSLLADSVQRLMSISARDLHRKLVVTFANEPGIDAGGLTREWYLCVAQQLFSPDFGLFAHSQVDNLTYSINPASALAQDDHLTAFRFAGRFLAKALVDQQVVPAHISLPLFRHLLGHPITLEDVEFEDAELYKSLRWIRNNQDVEALGLDFTVDGAGLQRGTTEELKPDGSAVDLTDENKEEYIALRLRHRMFDGIREQLGALLHGFYEVVPEAALLPFDARELELVLCGLPEINVEDWRTHARYTDGYSERSQQVQWFWEVVASMTREQRARLLQFVTGTSRVPAQGFAALQGRAGELCPFTIVRVSTAESLYPRAHTCFNRLDLPAYSTREQLEEMMLAVASMDATGFTME